MMEDKQEYICLVNDEGQYSLWLSFKAIPLGWKKVGPSGSKEDCLNYINQVWTDMRPKSIRKQNSSL